MNIDWSKAPEGTTHVNQFNDVWIKSLGGNSGQYQAWLRGHWEMGFGCMSQSYIQRPPQQIDTWNSDSLPPVGKVCEYKRAHEWQKVEVFAVKPNNNGSQTALFTYENGCWAGCAEPSLFRPIRTAEQIAADKRDEEVIEMMALNPDENPNRSLSKWLCEALYDAGYRKQAQP